jgi:hypothetical protein
MTTITKRAGVTAAALALSGALVAGSALSADAAGYGGGQVRITATASVSAGKTATVSASNLKKGTSVVVRINGKVSASATAARDGATVSVDYKAPSKAGRYTIVVTAGTDKATTILTIGTVFRSISASASSAKARKSFTIAGKATKLAGGAVRGAKVVIQYSTKRTSGFRTLGSASTSASGAYADSVKIARKGTYYVRVGTVSSGKFNAVTKTIRVTVR